MRIVVAPDAPSLARTVADGVAEGITSAVAERRRAVVAFSGGTTPAAMLRDLAGRELPWTQVVVVQVDERVAPDGDADRNATMLSRELLDRVPAIAYLMPVTAGELTGAAAAYDSLLQDLCGGRLDVVHLGLGTDGHTASLVPGDPILDVDDADVGVTAEYQGRRRMTLTARAINRARIILWEVAGRDKAIAVRALVDGLDIPGALIAREPATLMADAAAASLLSDEPDGAPGSD